VTAGMQALTLPPGVDPALTYAQPDIEWHIYQVIAPLGGTVTWSFAGNQGDPPGWIFRTQIQVDVRASSKGKARQRADEARRAIQALPWTPWDEGVVSRVDVTAGPFWQPGGHNEPRYVARYLVTYQPQRWPRPA